VSSRATESLCLRSLLGETQVTLVVVRAKLDIGSFLCVLPKAEG
jgi:hypothetical protein